MFLIGLIIAIILAIISKNRKYPAWEIILWFVAGFLFNIISIPVFLIRSIIEKKGWSVGLASGALIAVGSISMIYDFGRVLSDRGWFSRPELGAASIIGVLLIIAGIFVAFLAGKKGKTIEEKLSELDNLLSTGKISNEEHAELRKSILLSHS
ncbi:hypothetical protein [Sinimarinibacterium sp. CAU 1509]|uniref:hypothetical protein n=1 Tax=Sinimarinibacterium sp. CAU 1509 TaxID=2562283 RepID=UPI001B7FC4D1|nr:hypothetical protein [Sinimarinibacterium sp. CAU 1509]